MADPSSPPAPIPAHVWVVMGFAVLGVSSSAVLVRGMVAPALVIAAWRTLGSSMVLAVPGVRGRGTVSRAHAVQIGIAGVALALHFWAWFASLQQTTILRSTLLVALVPAWTALLEWVGSGVRPRAAHWLGLAIALPGLGLLAGTGGEASWWGDGLAVIAGQLGAVYFLIGRRVRATVPATTYMALVCAVAAGVLFAAAGWLQVPLTGWSWETWALIGGAVIGPQLVGHQGFAYALRWVPAATASTWMLLEPVGAAALGALVFGEIPGAWAVAGSALVLAGIAAATWESPPRIRRAAGGLESPDDARGG